ncbi:MAG: error-prone DNA polymerase [Burkholderiaceae bacterium]|nr:MAG: error-prone DNA polymerase [Burkholderiaceae bacterium]TAM06184.1 MAG: error-prone DNA polymerase [Pusillimonas sp.]
MSVPTTSPTLANYTELDCLSNFSFLRGASHPDELLQRAAELGYKALALADDCSLAGIVRAHVAAKALTRAGFPDFRLIVGSRFFVNGPTTTPMQIIALARNASGYGNLSEFITFARMSSTQKNFYTLNIKSFCAPDEDYSHLSGLPDCLLIYTPRYGITAEDLNQEIAALLPSFRGRLWIGLSLHHRHDDALHMAVLHQSAKTYNLKLVAVGQVEMHSRSRQPTHDILAAIRRHEAVQQCGYALDGNAEHHLRSRMRLMQLYPEPYLQETLYISQLCQFNLDEIRYQYPVEAIPPGLTAASYLRQETFAGARWRYPGGVPDLVRDQIESELAIISRLNYEPYFLTVYDIVLFARKQGILCQGRGSAANSAVCYCLGITEVNPENGNALFARFVSIERNEPPDIDVDFEHQRREEVIQYIYGKYGRQRAALTAVSISYRTRSALRDVGKALGLDPLLVDRVAHSFHRWDGQQSLLDKMTEQGLDPRSRIVQAWASLTQTLKGFPRHLSQHPGGFVIAQGKLSRLVPIENAAMPDRSVVQWDKDDLDAMGMMKVDVLALGMLSALHRTLKLVSQRRALPFAIWDIPQNDTATFDMICRADTVGVFQIESRAQMSMLPRLRPRSFYDLVIQIAIVRPGPIHGDMVHPYLRRRQKIDPVEYPSGQIKQVLDRTLGVPIFQEQVMQIAMIAAGFSAGEADELRRSMAAWKRKGNVDHLRPKLIAGMLARGYSSDFAQVIYRQLEGFGEYGFPESHSASFAKLAYASAWLKCHEPEAFLAALLNSQPMGFYSASQLVQDARRHDVIVLPVDITASHWETTLVPQLSPAGPRGPSQQEHRAQQERKIRQEAQAQQKNQARSDQTMGDGHSRPAVRLGFHLITGLSQEAAMRVEAARRNLPFSTTHDLALRASLSRHDMDTLATADALLPLSGHRRLARWQAADEPLKGLLCKAAIPETAPPCLQPPSEREHIMADYQALGLSLRRHPLALLRKALEARRFMCAATLYNDYPHKRLARACGIVTVRQRPQTAKGIVFVSLEDETGLVNVIIRPDLAARQHVELLQSRLMGVYGVWQRQSGVCHLLASRLVDLTSMLDELPDQSRNFH